MKEIPLSQGQTAIVDDADFEMVRAVSWCAHWNIGAHRWEAVHTEGFSKGPKRRGCRQISMAQFLIGKAPQGRMIDHRNGNQLDNRRENLRFATRSENARNRKHRCDSTLRFKGIKRRVGGKFQARIQIMGRRVSLGSNFVTQEDAALAYNVAARKHFGEFARINEELEAA